MARKATAKLNARVSYTRWNFKPKSVLSFHNLGLMLPRGRDTRNEMEQILAGLLLILSGPPIQFKGGRETDFPASLGSYLQALLRGKIKRIA